MNNKQEYIPVRMVLCKLRLERTFLNTSPIQSGINDYEYQEEDDV